MNARRAMVIVLGLLGLALDAQAALRPGVPIPVKILYDNSGSMYPGYRPPGASDRRTREELNVRYFYEYPEFQQWLGDFVRSQTIVDGGNVEMWTFTSQDAFRTADLHQVHPSVPAARFSVERTVRNFPDRCGQTTHLVDSLRASINGFTGLVWLITDNVVETSEGVPDTGVDDFFRMLQHDPRFQSVHLFKLPFSDPATGQQSVLAIYGLIVAPTPIPPRDLAWYDRKFRTGLRFTNRRDGNPPAQLFPGREHLKLKDLRVDALELIANTNLKLLIEDPNRGLFKEGQTIRLQLSGEIKSYLTQHSVTAGRYKLQLATPFEPEEEARQKFGLPSLPPEEFQEVSDEIRQPIPPNGQRDVTAILQSAQPVSLSPKGLGAWFRMALYGATVRYTGTVQMSFADVAVRLEPARMEGIFGIERAAAIFRLQDVRKLDNVQASTAQVGFTVVADGNRSVVLLLIFAVLAALIGIVLYLLTRKAWYRIKISSVPETMVALHRLGRCTIKHEGKPVGTLSRGLLGNYGFAPAAGVTLKPTATDGVWEARFRDGSVCQVSIEPVGGGKKSAPKKPTVPAAQPPPRNAAPSVRPPLPKIDRPGIP